MAVRLSSQHLGLKSHSYPQRQACHIRHGLPACTPLAWMHMEGLLHINTVNFIYLLILILYVVRIYLNLSNQP